MLADVGYALGPSWEDIMDVFEKFDLLVVAGLVVIVIWYVKRYRDGNHRQSDCGPVNDGQP
jgi:hypothetical protein